MKLTLTDTKHSGTRSDLTHNEIRALFLAAGFKIPPGQEDLKDYVYAAAHAVIREDRLRRRPKTITWEQALDLSEKPDVDDSIRNFLADPTEDNAVEIIVQAVTEYLKGEGA